MELSSMIGVELFGVCILAKLSSTHQYIIPFAILVRVILRVSVFK
jgi:hypothetical protein